MAKRRIIPVFIPMAGCPGQCVFCDQRRIAGVGTPVTPAQVAESIRSALPAAGRGCELAFYGGSFTALPLETQRDLLAAAEPFLQRGDLGGIRLSTRPDAVDETVCALLGDYGVTTVELGCQSMDDRVLALSGRGHRSGETVRAAALLREHGFSLILQMMTGLPGDTGPESMETARRIAALRADGVRIYPTVVLRGTELERMTRAGTYTPQTLDQAVDLCADLYQLFLAADIPVIRLGLNPTADLEAGAVAGAYHPALGELVLSELYFRRARALLAARPVSRAALRVHPSRVSVMVGQRRRNLERLTAELGLERLRVLPTAAGLWDITLEEADGCGSL